MKAKSLQDLGHMAKALAQQREQAAAEAAARERAAREAQARKELFTRAVGQVHRLPQPAKVSLKPQPPGPVPVQSKLDEASALREAISDEFDASTLLDTDDALSFRRPGIGRDVLHKLRRGDWSLQREIDLHGLRSEEARDTLSAFIREAHRHGMRCVRVVHGKGLGSPGKQPVLKSRVHSWLIQKSEVLAFVAARPAEGGAGALLVLLQPSSAQKP